MDLLNTKPELNQASLEKFAIDSPGDIRNIIQNIVRDEHELYVYLEGDETYFITEILDLDLKSDAGVLSIAKPIDRAALSAIHSDVAYSVVCFPDGIKVQFNGRGIPQTKIDGVMALSLALPNKLYRLQRREYFRVMIDEKANIQMKLMSGPVMGEFELSDLSIAGCAIRMPTAEVKLSQYDRIDQACIYFGDSDTSLPVVLTVKNQKPDEENADYSLVGCELTTPHAPDQARLQRHLLAIERRQRTVQALGLDS